MLILGLVVAIVVQDQTPLKAAPRAAAPRQAMLWRGDWLEVRGEKLGFVQVWDHRRERPGYVQAWQVRTYPLEAATAPALRAVIEFLRDTPGSESLGLAYVALYLKVAPAGGVTSDVFDALGVMAERLGRRASVPRNRPDPALAEHLDVAASYGVKLVSLEDGEATRLCYDGEAFRRVLAIKAAPAEQARAALALTVPECIDPALGPIELQKVDEWRLGVLDRVDPSTAPPLLAARLRLRRAQVAASSTYRLARRGDAERAAGASERAVTELALVEKAELTDDDLRLYEETAVRVAAARWAGEPAKQTPARLKLAQGQPGETCVRVDEIERCTYGLVWTASLREAPSGGALTVAVQPLPGWVELWVFRNGTLDVLTPAVTDPELGYVELAGFSPDGSRLLVVREARVDGAMQKRFQILHTATLAVDKEGRDLHGFPSFRKWQSADWKGRTLALR